MSFVTQEDVFAAIEPVMHGVFEEFADGKPVTPYPFPRIPYRESIAKYGTDKPDLRNPIDDAGRLRALPRRRLRPVRRASWKTPKNAVWAIPAPGGGSPRLLRPHERLGAGRGPAGPRLHLLARGRGAAGAGPIAKNIGPERTDADPRPAGPEAGRRGLLRRRRSEGVRTSSPASARTKVGTDLNLVDEDRFEFCWIVDFPMFELNEETKQVDFSHNPFSMPQGELEALNTKDPLDILAYQYDIVCNGYELCSGAIRNHRPEIMLKAFEIAGYGADVVEEQFGGMLNAFRYGAPPHGGLAPGIDRIVMLLAGADRHPRGHRLPAEPAGPGPDDERAVRGRRTSSCKELHIRAGAADQVA